MAKYKVEFTTLQRAYEIEGDYIDYSNSLVTIKQKGGAIVAAFPSDITIVYDMDKTSEKKK